MGYLCTSCLREYIKEGLNLTKNSGYNYRCPSVDCGDFAVVEIDDMILYVIKELNKKGYKTFYCCSGHSYENDANTYICFDGDTVPKTVPIGFILEDEEYYKQNRWSYDGSKICIRKWYKNVSKNNLPKELLKTALDLIEWVDDLPYFDEVQEYDIELSKSIKFQVSKINEVNL